MKKARVKTARGPMQWFLRTFDFLGVTMPWRTIYVRQDSVHDQDLIEHEMAHCRQIEEDGALVFVTRWLFWTWRYGYWDNPYEIEACRLEVEARARRERLEHLLGKAPL